MKTLLERAQSLEQNKPPLKSKRMRRLDEYQQSLYVPTNQMRHAMTVHRLLYIIAAVVAVSFLAAVATLILALTMIMSRNTPAACTDCAALQGKLISFDQLRIRSYTTLL